MISGTIIFFIFGTIIGSFLNVVILRYNTGRDVVRGRSACPVCRHELGIFELVPILSFALLGGHCRKCLSKISWQYPLVEFLTGLIFAAVFLKNDGIYLSSLIIPYALVIFSLLIIVFIYDMKHKIIPDGIIYSFIVLSLLKILISNPFFDLLHPPLLLDLLAGPIIFLPFFLLWFFSGGRWMGFGDAKLALGIGWFLGLTGAISAVVLGFWLGAGVGVIILFIQSLLSSRRLKKGRKRLTIKSEIPFAPFLIAGLWLVYFFSVSVVGLPLFLIQ